MPYLFHCVGRGSTTSPGLRPTPVPAHPGSQGDGEREEGGSALRWSTISRPGDPRAS